MALHIADKDLIGTEMPSWWGFAYREHEVRYTVLYPIPMNLIVRYTLKLFWLVYRWVAFSGWEDKLDDAYWRGYNDGNISREHHYDRLAKTILEHKKRRRSKDV